MRGQGGEFQLLMLLTTGTLPYLVKPQVRTELTCPCPHLLSLHQCVLCKYLWAGGEDDYHSPYFAERKPEALAGDLMCPRACPPSSQEH